MEHTVSGRQLVRIKQKGQLTLPARLLRDLGLKEGDLVEVERTSAGQIVITPQEILAMRQLDEIGRALEAHGVSLEELIESGREIRAEFIDEQHERSRNT
jgi:AbrB family looped-hinge helix DNA binding protein